MRLLRPFVAGALAVLIFHQGALTMLYALGVTPRSPFVLTPTGPLGVPQVLSLAFWGGVWGLILWPLVAHLEARVGYWVAVIALGAIGPSLVAWFVVAPLKGQPIANGWQPAAIATSLLINGAWGFGLGLMMRPGGRARLAS